MHLNLTFNMCYFVIRRIDYIDIIHIVQKGYAVYFIIINNNFFCSYTANFLQHYSL